MDIKAYVWDEHEQPQEVRESAPQPGPKPLVVDRSFHTVQERLLKLLEAKEYGKIERQYPGKLKNGVGLGETVIYYRAFDDPFRGRQIVCSNSVPELDKHYQRMRQRCALKVFSPAELYAMKPVRVDYDSWHTITVHFRDEVQPFGIDVDKIGQYRRFEVRTLVDRCEDGRRTWTLQTVWFDGKPVMVVNSSGRDGDEYHNRWITDAVAFGLLVGFLQSFAEPEDKFDYASADDKIPDMTEFYGGTIHDYYDAEAQEPEA